MADTDTIHQLYRVAHTLKGSAYTVGCEVVGDIAYPIETCMTAVREGPPAWHQVDRDDSACRRCYADVDGERRTTVVEIAAGRTVHPGDASRVAEGEPRAEEVGAQQRFRTGFPQRCPWRKRLLGCRCLCRLSWATRMRS